MIKSYIKLNLIIFSTTLFSVMSASAYNNYNTDEAAAGCMACGGIMFFMIWILPTATNIALGIWVILDTKNREVENPILWILLTFFLPLIGFLIYILSARPKGKLVVCGKCGKKHLEHHTCPHCKNT